MSTKTLMTVEEFAQMASSDVEDYELVEGELIPLSSGTPKHAIVRDYLVHLFWNFFSAHPIGRTFAEVDCRLGESTVRRPDVSVFLNERLAGIDLAEVPVPVSPDIAIEVLSHSESAIDVNRRVLAYLASGCKEVWIIDSDNAEFFVQDNKGMRLLRDSDLLESPLLPGFALRVAEVWAVL